MVKDITNPRQELKINTVNGRWDGMTSNSRRPVMKCEDCKFWFYYITQEIRDKNQIKYTVEKYNRIGYCKRFPKSFKLKFIQSMVYKGKSEPSVREEHPLMNQDDWCGEFKPRE